MRIFTCISAGLTVFLGLNIFIALTPHQARAEDILLGSINSLTGRLSVQGQAVQKGVEYAVAEANQKKLIPGKTIKLISRDDQGRPEQALAAAEELLAKQQVMALVGGYVDSLVGPISGVAEKYRRPYLAAASLDERLTARGYKYFFRISSLVSYVESTTNLALSLGIKKVGILYSSTPGASQLAQKQKELLAAKGITIAPFEMFNTGLSDFSPLLAKIKQAQTELLLFNGFFADNLQVLRQIKEQDLHLKYFLGVFAMEFPQVISQLGNLAEGAMGTTSWEPGITYPGTEKWAQEYMVGFTKRYGVSPDPLTMHGYTSARAVIEALAALEKKGQKLTAETLRQELSQMDKIFPLERLRFNDRGEPLHYERLVIQIQKGQHRLVFPPGRAETTIVPLGGK